MIKIGQVYVQRQAIIAVEPHENPAMSVVHIAMGPNQVVAGKPLDVLKMLDEAEDHRGAY